MSRSVLALAALSLTLVGSVLAQDAEGLKVRLEAYFSAKDAEAKKKALDAFEGAVVPKDLKGRVAAIKRVVTPPTRKGGSRVTEKVLERDCYFVPPKSYDVARPVATVVSFFGREGNGHHGLWPFIYPDEEWDEFRKPLEEEMKKKHGENAKIKIENPRGKYVRIAWEDGIVVGPTVKQDLPTEETDEVVLACLERLLRTYAADPDRVLVSGMSLGGAAACQLACRHPDRFAGLLSICGYDPNSVENLQPLQVYLWHGAKDDDVKVEHGRRMDELLTAADVKHVYKENPKAGHEWPAGEDAAKIKTWLKERRRDPWPKQFHHRFTSPKNRRCFWVEVAPGQIATVDAKVEGNEIDLTVTGSATAVLHLGEPLVDLEKDVVVRWGTREVFRGKVARSWKELLADVDATGFDLPRAAPARVEVKAP